MKKEDKIKYRVHAQLDKLENICNSDDVFSFAFISKYVLSLTHIRKKEK